MLTGSVAYASGTQIEVYFNKLKYMFDGIEKKPTAEQGEGFIYNGTTYVPVESSVNEQYVWLKQQFGAEELEELLSKEGLSVQDLRHYLIQVIGAEKYLMAEASDEKLKPVYDAKLAAYPAEFVRATVRHILIGFEDAAGQARTKEEAKKKALEIQSKLKNGEDFATLARQFSEDAGSKEEGGLYDNEFVSIWVEPFKNAVLELQLNHLSDPVETDYGYHVIRVEGRSTLTFEQVKKELKYEFVNQAYETFMNSELPKLIERFDLRKE
ncbi:MULTISPECIES: peptidylprolyl isomerase [unclassified Paenibacillus]|uniref:peptidylprolyl isomerase n=1 Tax=unclassified Paenibacillus TaxID=185978 RepID=UPI001B60B096|nr:MULTISPECIES: peptidylprolyl isomerase [unclassified Paenibacillus]MBP1155327.1 parvulin-like peptidyl-prolyl isomerase [Paenibacillus sp. PvP091]MBP1169289.1 parvulin-like peptidyl-prolyl isomerase [Paenibacillus sp. PvR098]MBP2440317.1 parvulin-like peptidyl-prolyl isomerase [Paenibacillus sp. PvP052]